MEFARYICMWQLPAEAEAMTSMDTYEGGCQQQRYRALANVLPHLNLQGPTAALAATLQMSRVRVKGLIFGDSTSPPAAPASADMLNGQRLRRRYPVQDLRTKHFSQ